MGGWTVVADGAHEDPGYQGSYCDTAGTINCTSGSPFRGDYTLDELYANVAFQPSPVQADLVASSIFHKEANTATWDGIAWTLWTSENWTIPLVAVALYLLMLLLLIPFMRDRKPINKAYINPVVAAWNLGLSLFSFWGLYWTAPHLYSFLVAPEHGFRATVCYSAQWYGHGYCGKAMAFFIYSKLFELFDTLWLILKKRPVIFLHSYHHITVLLYCWHSYASRISSGLWFGTMNYCVHSLMYFYYFLMTFETTRKYAKPFNWILTTLQTSQMAVGIFVTIQSMNFGENDSVAPCNVLRTNSFLGLFMYASYFVLFLHFAIMSYCTKPKGAPKDKKKTR